MPAGVLTTCCPISARRKTTNAAPTNSTAPAGRSASRTCATGIRSPWPMSRRRCNAAIRATTISTARCRKARAIYQTTMRDGVRSSAAHGYLKAARRRANLKVVSKALATRIVFDGRRATGVEYLVGNDKRSARANAEVIVASGAFNSPQLLQLSGLGPASLLKSHGIAVIADAPGVGDDLNDHISGRIILRCKEPITLNDAVRKRKRQAHPRLALRPHAPRLSRHPGGVFRMFHSRASHIGNARLAMLDFAVLGPDHRWSNWIRSRA